MLQRLHTVRDRLTWMLAIAMIVAIAAPPAASAAVFVEDAYSGATNDYKFFGAGSSGGFPLAGQSFTASSEGTLDSVVFWLGRNVGTVTGNAYAVLYAHSGVYGTSSLPTGDPLATSDPVDVSTLSLPQYPDGTSPVTFHFDNTYTLTAGTHYVIAAHYEGSTWLLLPTTDVSSAHTGNYFYNDVANGAGLTATLLDTRFIVCASPPRVATSITAPTYAPPTRVLRKIATIEATVTPAAAAVATGDGFTLSIYKKHLDRKTKVVTWPLYKTASVTGDPATGKLVATISALSRGEYHLVVDYAGASGYLPSTSPEGTFIK